MPIAVSFSRFYTCAHPQKYGPEQADPSPFRYKRHLCHEYVNCLGMSLIIVCQKNKRSRGVMSFLERYLVNYKKNRISDIFICLLLCKHPLMALFDCLSVEAEMTGNLLHRCYFPEIPYISEQKLRCAQTSIGQTTVFGVYTVCTLSTLMKDRSIPHTWFCGYLWLMLMVLYHASHSSYSTKRKTGVALDTGYYKTSAEKYV